MQDDQFASIDHLISGSLLGGSTGNVMFLAPSSFDQISFNEHFIQCINARELFLRRHTSTSFIQAGIDILLEKITECTTKITTGQVKISCIKKK